MNETHKPSSDASANREVRGMVESMSTPRLERLYPLAVRWNPALALRILAELHRRHGCLEGW